MNLIPQSNGFKRVNMREKADAKQWVKNIAFVIIGIFLTGFLVQVITNFIGNERIESSLNYAKVDNKRMEYKLSGTGDYTIVFDGEIGTNLYEWNPVIESMNDKGIEAKTFVYNRRGYGFSDAGSIESPEQQAESLKILLRKAGVSGKLILVGEGYGSLVMEKFAELYSDSVSGMLLVKPYSKEILKSKEFKKDIKFDYLRSKLEKIGTKFSLTMLMDKMNLDFHNQEFEESLNEDYLEEFNILKNQTSYRKAVSNELENLYSYNDNAELNGLMKGKPLYIITNNENDSNQYLGDKDLTTIYKTESDSNVLSVSDPSAIVNGISSVVRDAKKIAKKTGN